MNRLLTAIFLSLSLLPASGGRQSEDKVKILYTGIRWDASVPENIQQNIDRRIEKILLGHRKQLDITIRKGASAAQAASTPSSNSADCDSGYSYIFGGAISNPQPGEGRVLLVGNLLRYSCVEGKVIRFEITKYSEAIGVELVKFEQQMVNPLILNDAASEAKLAGWVFLGLALTFMFVLRFVSITVSGGGETGNGGSTDTP